MSDSERLAMEWTRAYPTVAAYVSAIIPDFHQAEDVLQQVAVTLVRKFDLFDRSRPFCGWAMGIARLEILKYLKRNGTERHVFSQDLLEAVAAAYGEQRPELDGRREALAECIQELKGRSRMILELRYVDDLKPEALAEPMGMTAGAVRALLFRLRESLRACIERRVAKESIA